MVKKKIIEEIKNSIREEKETYISIKTENIDIQNSLVKQNLAEILAEMFPTLKYNKKVY